jgi:cardiolipin synthase
LLVPRERLVEASGLIDGDKAIRKGIAEAVARLAKSGVALSPKPSRARTPYPGGAAALAQVLPSGPGYASANNLAYFAALVHAAQHELVLVTPYCIPDES